MHFVAVAVLPYRNYATEHNTYSYDRSRPEVAKLVQKSKLLSFIGRTVSKELECCQKMKQLFEFIMHPHTLFRIGNKKLIIFPQYSSDYQNCLHI